MRYILRGVEISMGLPAFKEAFEEFKETLPAPVVSPTDRRGQNDVQSPEDALDVFNDALHKWWVSMLGAIDRYRKMINEASKVEGQQALRFGLDVGVSYIVDQIERTITLLEQSAAPPEWTRQSRTPQERAYNSRYAKRYVESFRRHIERAHRLRNAALTIAWDYDPDARGGDEFDHVDELLAALHK